MSDIEIIKNESGINLEYDEVSPITKNKCVIVEADTNTGDEHRMCMESGYITRTSLVFNSDACKQFEQGCSELMVKLKLIDNVLNTVWYPTFMQMPGVMMYAEGKGGAPTDYNWSISKVIPIEGDERLKYPIPGRDDEYYTTKLDVDNAIKFEGYDFQNALDAFYTIAQEKQNEN